MADSVTVTVHGLKELSQALQDLPKQLRGKALGAAVKAGADLIKNAAQSNVPIDTGAVKKSIVAFRKRGSTEDNISYQVGVTLKKKFKRKNGTDSPYYWRFLEFGTVKMGARPFMRPAFDYRSGEALALIKKMLAKAVEIAAQHAPKYTGGG